MAFYFDGDNDYFRSGTSGWRGSSGATLSFIAAWVKRRELKSATSFYAGIKRSYGTATSNAIAIGMNPTNEICTHIEGARTAMPTAQDTNEQGWYHVMLCYQGPSDNYAGFDGTFVDIDSANTMTVMNMLFIGAHVDGSNDTLYTNISAGCEVAEFVAGTWPWDIGADRWTINMQRRLLRGEHPMDVLGPWALHYYPLINDGRDVLGGTTTTTGGAPKPTSHPPIYNQGYKSRVVQVAPFYVAGGGGPTYGDMTGSAAGTSSASGTLSDGAGTWEKVAYWSDLPGTKGDLLTYGSSLGALGIGPNSHILIPDSAQPSGMKWAAYNDLTAISAISNTADYLPIWDATDDTHKRMTIDQLQAKLDEFLRLDPAATQEINATAADAIPLKIVPNAAQSVDIVRIQTTTATELISVTSGGILRVMNPAVFKEVSAPSTPSSGEVVVYAKTDGLLYSKDSAGTETLMSGGSSSTDYATGIYWASLADAFDDGGDGVYEDGYENPGAPGLLGRYVMSASPFEEGRSYFGLYFRMPSGFSASSHATSIRVRMALSGATTPGPVQVTVSAYEALDYGATAGTNLGPSAQTVSSSSYTDFNFTVSDATLLADDILAANVQCVFNNTGGGQARYLYIDRVGLRIT